MKRILSLLLVCVFLFVLAGCNSVDNKTDDDTDKSAKTDKEKDDTAGAKEEDTKEKVAISYYWVIDQEAVFQPIVDRYNEISDVAEVKFTTYPLQDYEQKMDVLMAGGEAIDTFCTRFIAKLAPWIERGVLEPLNDYIKEHGIDMSVYGPGYKRYSFDDVYYSLPQDKKTWLLYINNTILEEEGIEIPENMTWDEYADIALKLTEGEGADKRFGGQFMPWVQHMQLVQAGKTFLDDDLSELKASILWRDRVYNVDKSFMSLAQMQEYGKDYVSWFMDGKTATMIQGDWAISYLKDRMEEENKTLDYSMIPMPIYEGVEPMTTGGNFSTSGIFIGSQNKDAAFDWIKFLCYSEEASMIMAKEQPPAYTNERIINEFIKNTGQETVGIIFDFKVYDLMPNSIFAGQLNTMVKEESELYLYGEQDIETTMENIYARRAKIFNSN